MRDIKTVFYRTCTYTVNTGRNTAPTKQCKVGYGGSKKNVNQKANRNGTDFFQFLGTGTEPEPLFSHFYCPKPDRDHGSGSG
jgi:hypothetical protein